MDILEAVHQTHFHKTTYSTYSTGRSELCRRKQRIKIGKYTFENVRRI